MTGGNRGISLLDQNAEINTRVAYGLIDLRGERLHLIGVVLKGGLNRPTTEQGGQAAKDSAVRSSDIVRLGSKRLSIDGGTECRSISRPIVGVRLGLFKRTLLYKSLVFCLLKLVSGIDFGLFACVNGDDAVVKTRLVGFTHHGAYLLLRFAGDVKRANVDARISFPAVDSDVYEKPESEHDSNKEDRKRNPAFLEQRYK